MIYYPPPPVVGAGLLMPGFLPFGFAGARWTSRLAAECGPVVLGESKRVGLYFVVRGRVVEYVGESTDIAWRCAQHVRRWPGSRFFGLDFDGPADQRRDLEAGFIAALWPAGNKDRPGPSDWAWDAVVALLSCPLWAFRDRVLH